MLHVKTKCLGQTADRNEEQREERVISISWCGFEKRAKYFDHLRHFRSSFSSVYFTFSGIKLLF